MPRLFLLVLAGLIGLGTGIAWPAEDSGADKSFVLLRNGNVLVGTPRQEGDRITVELGKQQVIRLPANQVLCWANDRLSLYRYRIEHRTEVDSVAHLETARWCIAQGLLAMAQRELQAAAALQPGHPSVAAVESLWRTAIAQAKDPAPPVSPPESPSLATPGNASSRHGASQAALPGRSEASAGEPMTSPAEPRTGLSAETVAEFAARVQPLLVNRCGQAGCHSGQGDESLVWRLRLPVTDRYSRMPAELTRENLREVLAHLDAQHPSQSPLLREASRAHGGLQEPPLGFADQALRQTLSEWLRAASAQQPEAASNPQAAATTDPEAAANPRASVATRSGREIERRQEGPPRPRPLPPVTNPFDPSVFNRLRHRH